MTDSPDLLSSLLAELGSVVGDAHVLTDPDDVAAYDTDWRGAYSGRPLAVVRPGSTAEGAPDHLTHGGHDMSEHKTLLQFLLDLLHDNDDDRMHSIARLAYKRGAYGYALFED